MSPGSKGKNSGNERVFRALRDLLRRREEPGARKAEENARGLFGRRHKKGGQP